MTSAATFSAWIYPTGPGSDAFIGGIIFNKEGEHEIARFPDRTIQSAFANSNPGWSLINSGYVAPLNQWTHVAVTYDNGVVKTYINGTLTNTYSGAGSIGDVLPAQNDFRIGGRQALSENFQGRIDEARVYNRVLSATEAAMLPSGSSGALINWLVTDQLGTRRMMLDQTGALNNVKRHDYLPFGEELFAPTSGRTAVEGYAIGDGLRQHFTQKERDIETGLDYFGARYFASTQGRFTSADPLYIELRRLRDPQQLNIYSYTRNNPLRFTDPNGLDIKVNCDDKKQCNQAVENLNNRTNGQFKVEVKDGKLKVVGRVDAAKLSQAEKGLYNAITDTKNTATINVVANTGQSEFGTHDSRGVNTVDLENLTKLDAPSNKGGLNSGDVIAHEAMDAYFSLSMDENAADGAAAELYPALFLPEDNVNQWNRANTDLISSTFTQRISDGRGAERISFQYITPIPAADLMFNSAERRNEIAHEHGSRVTEVTFVPKKP